MANMTDVAKLANVSTATVSRVIQNPETVKEKTRVKVLQAIEELNYQPNILARYFRRTETKTILVVVPSIANNVFPQMIEGIDLVANQSGYKVLLGNTNQEPDKAYSYIEELKQKQVDGMILLTTRLDYQIISELGDDYPVVLTSDYIEGLTAPTVAIDNISSARVAVEHLLQLGHQRVGIITGPLDIPLSRDRLKGYRQALLERDIGVESVLIQEGSHSYESGYNQMQKFLALDKSPTAIFAANDTMAMGAIKAVKAHGLRVPEDVAVVGFDNIQFSAIFEPALTTIAQPFIEMGKRSMELLLKQIKGEPLEKKQHVLDTKLIIRESCGSHNQD
ncbi:LacI family DNA-binding transcriptional regulator [Guptibacillus hwajinpoensis]|uniref:LacI family repressor for deo operon, udp, cdd, tsx, nupC, and nupG n=1 Tax=Guptibacillus hwajinpoensis TaxID=208199 RepID=A0ABU0K199_9BACL|nr:LacI family DNA-binding transcriptional regulator [Alkalihalobacillus hemicentroti]MDQ0482470.1 LacI family repressor for deo operon, udp, cdd, tsx, nupC, and nupG [Alkalihalobacillus hemicentroti]